MCKSETREPGARAITQQTVWKQQYKAVLRADLKYRDGHTEGVSNRSPAMTYAYSCVTIMARRKTPMGAYRRASLCSCRANTMPQTRNKAGFAPRRESVVVALVVSEASVHR